MLYAIAKKAKCVEFIYNSPCKCDKVVTDILGKIEFSFDFESTSKTHNWNFGSSLKP